MKPSEERGSSDSRIIPKDAWAQRILLILDLLDYFGKNKLPQSIPQIKKSGRITGIIRDPDIKKLIVLMMKYEWLKPIPKISKRTRRIQRKKDPALHYPLTEKGKQVLDTITQLRKDKSPLISLYIFSSIGDEFVD